MRAVDAAAQAVRAARAGLSERILMWIEARDRATNAVEALGVWSGEDDEAITVQDLWSGATVTRTFAGAGALLAVAGIRHQAGLAVRPATVSLSALDPSVAAAVRLYDARGGRVQIWKRTYAPETGLPAGHPERLFKGFVNGAPIPRPVPGGEAVLEMELVSSARLLTIPAPRLKSDAAQQLRDPEDRFRRYKAAMGTADIPWGQRSVRGGQGA